MAADDAKTPESLTVGQRLDQAIDSTREKLSQATGSAKERITKGKDAVTELRDKGRETVAELRDKGRETVSDLRKKNLDDVVTSAKEFAKEHPGTTLLGGVALGFLVGFLIRNHD